MFVTLLVSKLLKSKCFIVERFSNIPHNEEAFFVSALLKSMISNFFSDENGQPQYYMFALSRGGDCETIEQYVLALHMDCGYKGKQYF